MARAAGRRVSRRFTVGLPRRTRAELPVTSPRRSAEGASRRWVGGALVGGPKGRTSRRAEVPGVFPKGCPCTARGRWFSRRAGGGRAALLPTSRGLASAAGPGASLMLDQHPLWRWGSRPDTCHTSGFAMRAGGSLPVRDPRRSGRWSGAAPMRPEPFEYQSEVSHGDGGRFQ